MSYVCKNCGHHQGTPVGARVPLAGGYITEGERSALALLATGHSYRKTGQRLGKPKATIASLVTNARYRLGLETNAQVIALFQQHIEGRGRSSNRDAVTVCEPGLPRSRVL